MRILLVQPTTRYNDKKMLRSRTRWLVGITLPYLAGLTPKGIHVDLVDDRLSPIPYNRQYDLVGITATCATAQRAFEISGEFRKNPWNTATRWWWGKRKRSGSRSWRTPG